MFMPKRDTMHLRSNTRYTALLVVIVLFCAGISGQQQPQGNAGGGQAAPAGVHREGTDNILVDQNGIPLEDQSGKSIPQQQQPQPQQQATAPAAGTPPQPGTPAGVQNKPEAPRTGRNGEYVFTAEVQEVQLHATVVDQHNRSVTGLNRNDFQVFEDGQPQQITQFGREDVPVSLGILIDNSGSMRDKRQAVNQAALNLIKASNPNDEVFVVNFNDEAYIDQDFTADLNKLREGLEHIDSRGGTAMYDAVVASADHLAKAGRKEKKVLLVVTDGEDNASRDTLEQAVRRVQDEKGPTIYTIGLLGSEKQKRARRALEALSLQTGGVGYFPKDLAEVNDISLSIAHDIRSQYLIQYRPNRPQQTGDYRTVRVEAHAGGYGKLQVRTKTGYYAGQERAANTAANKPRD
jgi:Ca-activated chloride channel homolog